MLTVHPKQTMSMHTRDGVRLDADVYYPQAEGLFPVLLMRQPYGRAIASTVVYAHPIWYAAHGYIVVIQDVRGRGSSQGEFDLFAHEIQDGFDAVNWTAALPGSSGQVGMYGFSYQGMTQLYAAVDQPPALKTLCPAMIGYDLYEDWAYEGGAFCWQTNLIWAMQLAAETARRQGDEATYRSLYLAVRNPPLYDPIPTHPLLLQEKAPDSFYHDWLQHPEPDEYWQKLSPRFHLQPVDLPMLHIGGWFDHLLRGTLNCYREMVSRSRFPQHLIVGPWTHLPWGRKAGTMDCGVESGSRIDRLQIRWFDHFLKGLPTGVTEAAPVQLFELGSNQWRECDRWPDSPSTPYFLASTGLASIHEQEGILVEKPPEQPCPEDVFVHDPWRPVPALGGHAAIPAGSWDRAALDDRTDIVTYTSAPVTEPLHLAGDLRIEVWCVADAPSFDLCAVLSQVGLDGAVYNLTQGYLRVEPGQGNLPLRLSLQAICACIAIGNCLRLSFSAACFPAYAVNSGTGAPSAQARLMDARVITLRIQTGGDCLSRLLLPVIAQKENR